jgi:hypothetical protein
VLHGTGCPAFTTTDASLRGGTHRTPTGAP